MEIFSPKCTNVRVIIVGCGWVIAGALIGFVVGGMQWCVIGAAVAFAFSPIGLLREKYFKKSEDGGRASPFVGACYASAWAMIVVLFFFSIYVGVVDAHIQDGGKIICIVDTQKCAGTLADYVDYIASYGANSIFDHFGPPGEMERTGRSYSYMFDILRFAMLIGILYAVILVFCVIPTGFFLFGEIVMGNFDYGISLVRVGKKANNLEFIESEVARGAIYLLLLMISVLSMMFVAIFWAIREFVGSPDAHISSYMIKIFRDPLMCRIYFIGFVFSVNVAVVMSVTSTCSVVGWVLSKNFRNNEYFSERSDK